MASERDSGIPWWIWAVLSSLAFFLFFRWLRMNRSQEEFGETQTAEPAKEILLPSEAAPQTPMVAPEAKLPGPAEEAMPAREGEVQAPPADFTRIEGIGPKINSLLHDAGFTTYEQIANTDVERLREILREANMRINAPDTWPEQARLAAVENWEGLAELKARLKGGRRVE
jgi:predicted flap endonuclease-1-like 5' DNA nuclease